MKTKIFKITLIAFMLIAAWIATIDVKAQTLNLVQNPGFEYKSA